MQIQSTMPKHNSIPRPPEVSSEQGQQPSDPPQDGFDRSDLYAGGAGLAGGLALGAGGAYLGMSLGVEHGFRAANLGGGPVGALLGVIVSIPLALAYGTIGAAAGGTIGAAAGVAAGYGAYQAFQ